jgi:hypothetical protein
MPLPERPAGTPVPADAPARLCELSDDARAAVLLDRAGEAVAWSHTGASADLAEAARDLLRAVDRAAGEQRPEIEAQVLGGSVYALRRPEFTLVAVARRSALSSLMLYDMRAVAGEVPGAATSQVPGG